MTLVAPRVSAGRPGPADGPYRAMVVDDSAAIRGVITRGLERDPEIQVIAAVGNGQLAIDTMKYKPVEVVILDIEMPVMDGMTALPKLLEMDPSVRVIMASTLTERGAKISLQALSLGAADYVPKPSGAGAISNAQSFNQALTGKVKALAEARRRTAARRQMRGTATAPTAAQPLSGPPIVLRRKRPMHPEVLAIGSSTGGPQALGKLFDDLKSSVRLPILVTQHMPPTFTKMLAEHIGKISGMPCAEGKNGEPVVAGHIYVAPGDHHMLVERGDRTPILRLSQAPPENFCRPAVDPMLRSIVDIYRGQVLAVILTGMGSDGREGCKHVVEAGGAVIAQDEASSIVWGMPGAVAVAGLCTSVVPIARMALELQATIAGRGQ